MRRCAASRDPVAERFIETTLLFEWREGRGMLKRFDRLSQRLSDPLLTVLTLMLSFLLFVLGPMQAAGVLTGQHFGYFFGLVLLPAAFLYSRNLFVAVPIAVAIGLVVAAALLEFERSARTDL